MKTENATPLRREQRTWLWGLAIVAAVITVPVGYLSISGMLHERRLAVSRQRACAEVTHQRVQASARRQQFEVQYVLSVATQRYTHSDETGRSGLWASVHPDDWAAAQRRGCVNVVYLEDDPSVNRPARLTPANHPVGNRLAGLFLCAMTLALCGGAAFGILRVARAELHGFELVGRKEWVLRSRQGERRVPIDSIKRATLIILPAARLHPPWRFDTDVLQLKLENGEEVLVEASPGPITTAATGALEALGRLRWRGGRGWRGRRGHRER